MKWIPIVLAVLVVGCVATRSPWVYPGARFMSEGDDELARQGQKLVEMWWGDTRRTPDTVQDAYGWHWSNELQRLRTDPFFTQSAYCVDFSTTTMGKDVDMYFDHVFFSHGWVKHRGEFSAEMTDSGPDHVSVYRKEDAFVKVHIFGPWDHALGEPPMVWTNCHYRISFIGLKPHELLGRDYKSSEQPTGAVTQELAPSAAP